MFKKMVNEALINFTIKAEGPLLIRKGQETGLDPTLPDHQFIRAYQDGIETAIIPGSSLKGVFRSRAEQVFRSMGLSCCNLFGENSCKKNYEIDMKKEESGKKRYETACLACRTFGCTFLAGRISFKDAYAVPGSIRFGQRNNVAINRITGAAKQGALFSPEVVEEGKFTAQVKMQNFELWQLAILMLIIKDLNDGFLTIGGCTTRGFGRVSVNELSCQLRVYENVENKQVVADIAGVKMELPAGTELAQGPYYHSLAVDSLDKMVALLDKVNIYQALSKYAV